MNHQHARSLASRPVLRVLFIGNSFTYMNNLGEILAGIAIADSEGPTIVPALATCDGASLKWHLENGSALSQLQAGGWNYVILQERSVLGGRYVDGKPVVGDPEEFFSSTREWVRRIRQAGATPILYMTWAHRSPSPAEMIAVQERLASAYDAIGSELRVTVAPVGLAWGEAGRRLPTLDLYFDDGSHPAPAGSYLAALVLYSTLTGRSPGGAPGVIKGRPARQIPDGMADIDSTLTVPLVDLPEATAAQLQDIAWTVLATRSRLQGMVSDG